MFRHGGTLSTLSALCFGLWLPSSGDTSVEPATLIKLTAATYSTVCTGMVCISKLWVSPVSKDASYLRVLIPVSDESRQFCFPNGIGANSGAILFSMLGSFRVTVMGQIVSVRDSARAPTLS